MKKKNLTNITVIALLIVLLTLIAVSGTYAKYTTSATGSGQAIVAKWHFSAKLGDKNLTESDTFTINLVDTATKGVVQVGDVKKIQPGTEGEITITIDNTNSDVAADLSVTATTEEGLPLTESQFEVGTPVIEVDGATATSVPAGKTATATITWKWLYDSSTDADTNDTTVGSSTDADNATLIDLVKLTITGTQAAVQ